jgi:capsular exopolysaccharide synthesis family protein
MSDHHLVSLDKSLDLVSDALRTVGGNLTAAKLDMLSLENLSQQVETFRRNNRDLLEISYIAGHGAVPTLRSQVAGLRQEQAALSERYYERHPKMIDLANRIQIAQSMLDREIQQAMDDLQTALLARRQNVVSLEAEYQSREKQELDLKAMSVDYDSLKSQADAAKSNYTSTLDRLNQTKTTKNLNLEKIPLHPLDSATPNYAPYAPNISGIVRTCIGLGILTFVGVAVGLSFIDDRVKSAWDIESFIGVNLLGIIPDLGNLKADDRYTLLIDNKQSQGVEPFLGIYSAIKIHSKLDFPKSILVTSTIPGEGKTLVSANLAGCFARHGKRTLLVDCDLRRPMLHRHFRQDNNAGIISWFENGASLEGDITANPYLGIASVGENLSVLTSGGRSKSPTSMLEASVFGQLMDRLKRHFDLIIVDSPPMGAVTDALLISESIDEIVYVCRFNRAYRKHIRLFIRTLADGKNTVLGIVLNGLSPRRIEYYSNYRYYRSYKKYYGAQT